jgi:archaetidylinositol phosphate synthase
MSDLETFAATTAVRRRPWDARAACRLVAPLKDTWVTPNHLTTLRLLVGLCAVAAFLPGTYGCSNAAALLLVLSNFLDHTDGELARISGKSTRFGHLYDLAADALVTILTFVAIGIGVSQRGLETWVFPPVLLGLVAGCAIALIFYLRMRIEQRLGKAGTSQASLGGFETEDVLYLLPLMTLCDGAVQVLMAASLIAPLYALWVTFEFRRAMQRLDLVAAQSSSG